MLLVTLFLIKLIARINIFKRVILSTRDLKSFALYKLHSIKVTFTKVLMPNGVF